MGIGLWPTRALDKVLFCRVRDVNQRQVNRVSEKQELMGSGRLDKAAYLGWRKSKSLQLRGNDSLSKTCKLETIRGEMIVFKPTFNY